MVEDSCPCVAFLPANGFCWRLPPSSLWSSVGYFAYDSQLRPAEATQEPPLQTSTVRQGDLVVSATGAGTVIPAQEVQLGFPSSGVLKELNVQVGDKVEAGTILARVDDTDAKAQAAQAEISLRQAQIQFQQLACRC